MRTGKGSQEEEEYEEEDVGSKKGGPSSFNQTMSFNANNNNSGNKDGKNRDKAAIRSKHSVMEQRRRSKINESLEPKKLKCHGITAGVLTTVFQRLRDLIPNPEQKRDTASFLLDVIEHVRYLQEKVKKYEDSYQGWSSEPTKLMPWRNSHWRVKSFVGQPQAIKNGSVPGSTFSHKFDENNININPIMMSSAQHDLEADLIRDATSNTIDRQPELANKGMPLPIRGDNVLVHPLQRPVSETQSTEYLINNDMVNPQEDLTIEGGMISVSSVYSQGLLNTLAQALQGTGLDLSQANISVQIDLGKHANRSAKEPHNSPHQAMTHLRDVSSEEDSDLAQKRLKK